MNFVNNGKPNGKRIDEWKAVFQTRVSTSKEKGAFEKFKEDFQRRVALDNDPVATVIAVAISWSLNRQTGFAFPSFAELAKATGLHPNTIPNGIRRLEARGHVGVHRHWTGKRRRRSHYYLCERKPQRSSNIRRYIYETLHARCGTYTPIDVVLHHTNRCVGTSDLPSDLPPDSINIAATKVADTKEHSKQDVREEGDNRESKESKPVIGGHFPALPQDPAVHLERSRSTIAECYRLAIKHEGKLGGSRVGLALKAGGDPDQVLQDIIDTVEDGGDLSLALSHYWQERTR